MSVAIGRVLRATFASASAVALVAALLGVTPSAHAQTYTLGIDVSHHQGTIDWNQVADSGHVYAFHKATEGATFTDPRYSENRASADAASLPFGAYHFARPEGGTIAAAQADAQAEAAHFLDVARPAPGDLVPVLDLEATGGLPPQRLIVWTQAWLDSVTGSVGVKPLVYTSPNFWRTNMNDTTTFADQDFPLWLAHYTSAAGPSVPAANWSGRSWAFWQWTSCAAVPGISGCVDEDRFSGSDLSAYTIPGAPEPEPTPDPATPPSGESPPTISGTETVGSTLTASPGTWSGSEPLAYSYAWFRCLDDGSGCASVLNGTEPTYELAPADYGHRMMVRVTATNSAGSATQDSAPSGPITDTEPPTAPRITGPRDRTTLTNRVRVTWEPAETDGRYELRVRDASPNSDFGSYESIVVDSVATSTRVSLESGRTYCFSARATDTAGNTSGWSRERCTTTPVDDRDMRAAGRWKRTSGSDDYRRTLSNSDTEGASLSVRRVHARVVELVAQRCPGCGTVEVLFDGRRVATVRLSARRERSKQVIPVLSFGSARSGGVEVVVRDGRDVWIDGLTVIR